LEDQFLSIKRKVGFRVLSSERQLAEILQVFLCIGRFGAEGDKNAEEKGPEDGCQWSDSQDVMEHRI
jgi:hypothetical protein